LHDNNAIQTALNIGGNQATYILIHIVESAAATQYGNQVRDVETINDEDNLKKYAALISNQGFKTNYYLGFGNRSKQIADIVNTQQIDFLVMAAHGHKALKDFIFGSTVDAVRHLVNIPVLVVK